MELGKVRLDLIVLYFDHTTISLLFVMESWKVIFFSPRMTNTEVKCGFIYWKCQNRVLEH